MTCGGVGYWGRNRLFSGARGMVQGKQQKRYQLDGTPVNIDLYQDCQVNLLDLAVFASEWLTYNHIYEKMCP
jgi:hypothetical protein